MEMILSCGGFVKRVQRKVHRAFCNRKGEAYVDTGLKILIAVVIGALLLGGLYALFGDTILPKLTQKITELFSYNG